MKFIWWLINTFIIDPLIFLFLWNVIISAMFICGKTNFKTCVIVSVIINVLIALYQFNKDN